MVAVPLTGRYAFVGVQTVTVSVSRWVTVSVRVCVETPGWGRYVFGNPQGVETVVVIVE